MNKQEAIKEIGKHQPCPHDAVQKAGLHYYRCEDCNETFRQSSLDKLRAEYARFMQALLILQVESLC